MVQPGCIVNKRSASENESKTSAPLDLLFSMRGFALFALLTPVFGASPALNYQAVFGFPTRVSASAVDAAGNVYLAGSTTSATFPVTPNAFQKTFAQRVCGYLPGPHGTPGTSLPCEHGFVAKVDASGTRLLYATYLGGDLQDGVFAMSIDSDGNAYVTGGPVPLIFRSLPERTSLSAAGS